MVDWRRSRVEAHLQRFVVMGIDSEAGDKAVDHEFEVKRGKVLTSGKGFDRVEQ